MKKTGRVIVIGLDGGDWDILLPLVREGKLPNIKRLINRGIWGKLQSTIPPISASAWVSLFTGKNPGKHGIFDFAKVIVTKNGYRIKPVTSRDIDSLAIWDLLSMRGKRVAIINVPMTYPPWKVYGIMISGFPCPEKLGKHTYPRKLIYELKKEFGKDLHFQPKYSPFDDEEAFVDDQFVIADYVEKVTLYIMERNYEFIWTTFVGLDALGHVLWKYIDENHPRYKGASRKLKQAITEMCIRLDIALGKILSTMNEDDVIILVSDHGLGPVYYAVSLNKWLIDEGFIKLKTNFWTKVKKVLFNLGFTPNRLFSIVSLINLGKKIQTEAYRERSLIKMLINKITLSLDDIDWCNTLAYASGNMGQIYINKYAIQGQQYTSLISDLIDRLKRLTHNDKQIFDLIYRKETLYRGKYLQEAPDIVCINSLQKYIVSRFFELGSNKLIDVHPFWSGTHRLYGIFAIHGRDTYFTSKRRNASVYDIAPTILSLYGLPIPKEMDGEAIV
ncbi:MAG: hypothetical protein DRJ59_02630 [Thermoprotei archaeon]|nr:MAG: hypothetical protein DRJ59_02630 [Thermoprotei archaeon]